MSIAKFGLTPAQVSEFDHCARDFKFFCDTYVKHNGRSIFSSLPYLGRWADFVTNNHKVIAKKFKDSSLGAMSLVYCLWTCMFQEKTKVGFIGYSSEDLTKIRNQLHSIMNELPDWLNPHPIQSGFGRYEYKLRNGSILFCDDGTIIGRPATPEFDLLVFDDIAYHVESLALWNSYLPKLKPNGHVIIQSRVRGDSGWFYTTYQNSVNSHAHSMKIFQVDYTEHPSYQTEDQLFDVQRTLGPMRYAQEVECKFLSHNDARKIERDRLWEEVKVEEPVDPIDKFIQENIACRTPTISSFSRYARGLEVPPLRNEEEISDAPGFRVRGVKVDKLKDIAANSYTTDEVIDIRDPKNNTFGTGMSEEQFEKNASAAEEIIASIEERSAPKRDYDSIRPVREGNVFEVEAMAETWKSVAEIMPEFQDISNLCQKFAEEAQANQPEPDPNSSNYISCDLLKLAGVMSLEADCCEEEEEDIDDYRAMIAKKIVESGLPDSIKLELGDDKLMVNGVKTKISTRGIEMAFIGLSELSSPEQALEEVSNLVRQRLSHVF